MQTANASIPKNGQITHQQIHLPEPTAWPILLAMGLVLCGASLVTNYGIGILGVLLTVSSSVGWFRDVLPHEQHEIIKTREEIIPVSAAPVKVRRIEVDPEIQRRGVGTAIHSALIERLRKAERAVDHGAIQHLRLPTEGQCMPRDASIGNCLLHRAPLQARRLLQVLVKQP